LSTPADVAASMNFCWYSWGGTNQKEKGKREWENGSGKDTREGGRRIETDYTLSAAMPLRSPLKKRKKRNMSDMLWEGHS